MRMRATVLVALCLTACAEPPPPLPPVVQLAPPLPPLPAAPPALLAVPRAEASPRSAPEEKRVEVPPLRSEGKAHAIERTKHGLLLLSEARGVVGVVKHAAEIRWAGFLEGDVVLIASGDTLLRAPSPDDAIAGRFEAIAKVDPAATMMASGGKVVAMVAPRDGGPLLVSRDGGKRFREEKRPTTGDIAGLEVRSDGVVVVATAREGITNEHGTKGFRAAIHVASGQGAWVEGPVAERFYGPVPAHHGDTIAIRARTKKRDKVEEMGLSAARRWIEIDAPEGGWLGSTWADSAFAIGVPIERPGFPKPATGQDGGGGFGLLGALSSAGACAGVACLARRSPVRSSPSAAAFHDGVCDKDRIVVRKETLFVHHGPGLTNGRDETYTVRECAKDAPAARASTLMLRTTPPSFVKLPVSCAEGRVIATDRAAFVRCSSKHQGKPALLHVAPSGAITEVVPSIGDDLEVLAAESASDGTTVIYADKARWLCRTDAPSCASIAGDGFLGARPVPGGRALVARRGASDHELSLELLGEASATPFRMTVQDNVLEVELTAEGYVRLWTSPSLTRFDPTKSERHLVRADGVLVRDFSAD